jgi:5,10-methylenetetrahydromethanopterin reductase
MRGVSGSDTSAPGEGGLGIGFTGYASVRDTARACAAAEEAGFTSAWAMETRITRDAVSSMTAALLATRSLQVGCAGVNAFTRGAGLVATTWAAMAEAAPGRVILGVSVGSASTLAQQGYEVDHAIGRLRELVEAVRAAWTAPSPVRYDGRYVVLRDLEPEVRPDPPPPVHFCVGGPQALALAARIGDGVLLDVFLSTTAVARMLGHVHDSAGGRFGGETGSALVLSIADSEREAAARLKPTFAAYLVRFPELAREMGLDEDQLESLRAHAASGGIDAVTPHVPDELVLRSAICGPASRCRERVAEYRDAGVSRPVLCPEPQSLEPTLRLMGGA